MIAQFWVKWLPVAFGGALGSLVRVWLQSTLAAYSQNFPLGTFTCNTVGSLSIGALAGLFARLPLESPWRLLLIAGFLGGFTTFSSFSLENMNLLRQGQIKLGLVYAFGSLVVGLLATTFGFLMVKGMVRSLS